MSFQRQHAEQLAARHALQAVFAAGERRLQADEVHHLRHRQRDHREVDALAADRDQADQQAEQAGGNRRRPAGPVRASSPAT
jgi:hypothetical protein